MSLPQHPLRTSSPRPGRPAPATGGGSTSTSGSGGGGAAGGGAAGGSTITSGGPFRYTSSIPAVALASPKRSKRKRSDPDHTRGTGGSIGGGARGGGGGSASTAMVGHTCAAGAEGLDMSGGIGIGVGGLPLGPRHHPGASASSGQLGGGGGASIFVPQHHRHGGGRPALNKHKAASWDADADAADHRHHHRHRRQDEDEFCSINSNAAAAYHDEDDGDESQYMYPYLDYASNGGNNVNVASAVVVGHPPPLVRKARRRTCSSSGQGDGRMQMQQMQAQQQIGVGGAVSASGGRDGETPTGSGGGAAGAAGAATRARPSINTAPAAMTPARGDGLGRDRAQVPVSVCPSSATGAGRSTAAGTCTSSRSSSGHYWTRSKPYPPQQQQPRQQIQQNMPSLFSPGPGIGGPPSTPSASNANADPPPSAVKPPAGKQHHHHHHHHEDEGDEEQTASTKSTINLQLSSDSDSSLLPGLTPMRGGGGERDRSASSRGGGGDHPTTTTTSSGGAGVEQHRQVPSSPATTFGFASYPASLPRLHALPPRTQPTPRPGGGGGGGFGSGTGGTGGAGAASRTKEARIDESEAWTTASATATATATATNAAAQASAAFDGSQLHHPRSYTSSSSALPPTHSAHRRLQSPNTSIDTMNDSTVSSISIDHGGGGGGGGQQQQQQQGSQSLHRQTRSDGTGSSSLRGGRWLDEDDGEGGGGGRKSQQQHEQDEEIGRTRLDCSSLLSPEPKASREGGSKQKHDASAPSAAPAPFASFGRTSFGGEGGDAAIGHRIVDESGVPLTPGAATLRFQLDGVTKCSPIPNGHHHGEEAKSSRGTVPVQPPLLEGQGDGPAFSTRRRMPLVQRKSIASDAKSSADGVNTDEEMQTRSPSKPSKTDPELSALSGVTASSSSETSTVHGSVGNGSHNTAGSSSKKSKARPMPDMSAFDGGGGGDGSPSSGGDGMAIDPSSPHDHPHPQHGASGQSGPIPPPSPYTQSTGAGMKLEIQGLEAADDLVSVDICNSALSSRAVSPILNADNFESSSTSTGTPNVASRASDRTFCDDDLHEKQQESSICNTDTKTKEEDTGTSPGKAQHIDEPPEYAWIRPRDKLNRKSSTPMMVPNGLDQNSPPLYAATACSFPAPSHEVYGEVESELDSTVQWLVQIKWNIAGYLEWVPCALCENILDDEEDESSNAQHSSSFGRARGTHRSQRKCKEPHRYGSRSKDEKRKRLMQESRRSSTHSSGVGGRENPIEIDDSDTDVKSNAGTSRSVISRAPKRAKIVRAARKSASRVHPFERNLLSWIPKRSPVSSMKPAASITKVPKGKSKEDIESQSCMLSNMSVREMEMQAEIEEIRAEKDELRTANEVLLMKLQKLERLHCSKPTSPPRTRRRVARSSANTMAAHSEKRHQPPRGDIYTRRNFLESFEVVKDRRQSDSNGVGVIARRNILAGEIFYDRNVTFCTGKPPDNIDQWRYISVGTRKTTHGYFRLTNTHTEMINQPMLRGQAANIEWANHWYEEEGCASRRILRWRVIRDILKDEEVLVQYKSV